ncbi:MAG: hypothetical protein HeimC3_44110 [Candidatus Heimdallarchaeota archaeon LC_3]|nr:MAG: hypothetical protein HeimC3_44110 [Candidatus Heimdallarchaeota archaeon LC_3]
MNDQIDIALSGKIIENLSEFKNFEVILNSLPFGISVQNIDRAVLYENEKAKELTGSFKLRNCFNRWEHLPDEGEKICKDCPAIISLLDKSPHKIFRKTLNKNSKEFFLEIQIIPILEKDGSINKFVEVLTDVTKQESAKVLVDKPVETLLNELQLSISKYGQIGGEILFKDEISFLQDKVSDYIQKLTMFTYIGVFQNNFYQEGFFGPLPVLDKPEKSMMVYSFRLNSENVTDPRKEGKEPCLLMMFFDRDNYFMFEKRNVILSFLNQEISKIVKIEDLNNNWFDNFKMDLKNLITKNLSGSKIEI